MFYFKASLWGPIILFLPPPHLQSLHYCNTIARLMRNIRPPPDPPYVCHTPYNIGGGNIVAKANPFLLFLCMHRLGLRLHELLVQRVELGRRTGGDGTSNWPPFFFFFERKRSQKLNDRSLSSFPFYAQARSAAARATRAAVRVAAACRYGGDLRRSARADRLHVTEASPHPWRCSYC